MVKTAGSAGVLSLSCARLTAGRVTTLLVKCPLSVSQQELPGQYPGRCPGLCAQAVGGGLGGRAGLVSDVKAH